MPARLRLQFVESRQTPALNLTRAGAMLRYEVTVDDDLPLRVCLACTDLPSRALQNDLSVLAESPSRKKMTGNGQLFGNINRSDAENDVERVLGGQPEPGVSRSQVCARSLLRGPQDFALVATGSLSSR